VTWKADTVEFIPLDRMRPNAWNPNELVGERREALKQDMKVGGATAIDPILVRPIGREERTAHPLYEIVDGESRWSIAGELKWRNIHAIARQLTEDQAKVLNYRKNYERGAINPIKEAKLFENEMAKGLSQEKIAEKYGITQSQVSYRLSLLQLPKPIQEKVMTRVITPTHAEIIGRIPSQEKQIQIAEKVAQEKDLSSRELESLVRGEVAASSSPSTAEQKTPDLHRGQPDKPPPKTGKWLDTGVKFDCPCCKGAYMILCLDGRHRLEEVRQL